MELSCLCIKKREERGWNSTESVKGERSFSGLRKETERSKPVPEHPDEVLVRFDLDLLPPMTYAMFSMRSWR